MTTKPRTAGTLIARRLKEARTALGLSQRNLGIKAGFDPSVASARVNQYERSKHAPHFRVVSKMAEVLGLPAAYFYATDDDLAHVIRAFAQLQKKQKTKLQTLIELLQTSNKAK